MWRKKKRKKSACTLALAMPRTCVIGRINIILVSSTGVMNGDMLRETRRSTYCNTTINSCIPGMMNSNGEWQAAYIQRAAARGKAILCQVYTAGRCCVLVRPGALRQWPLSARNTLIARCSLNCSTIVLPGKKWLSACFHIGNWVTKWQASTRLMAVLKATNTYNTHNCTSTSYVTLIFEPAAVILTPTYLTPASCSTRVLIRVYIGRSTGLLQRRMYNTTHPYDVLYSYTTDLSWIDDRSCRTSQLWPATYILFDNCSRIIYRQLPASTASITHTSTYTAAVL